MKENHKFSREELVNILNQVLNKTLGQVDVNHVFDKTIDKPKITGIAGDVIEQSVLGYSADSSNTPDLLVDGDPWELKTTGTRKKRINNSDVYVAKEPASITAVSINEIASQSFENSHFWKKAEKILFVIYLYDSNTTVSAAEYANFPILKYIFNVFDKEEETELKREWTIIRDYIKDIQEKYPEAERGAHYPFLSTDINKKLSFLDTAPKYPNNPRFRLRKRVVDTIIQKAFKDNQYEKLDNLSSYGLFEKRCEQIGDRYKGQTICEILDRLGHKDIIENGIISKQIAEQTICLMFGAKSKKLSKIENFAKLGYVPKSITLTSLGTRTEDMKLFPIDFDDMLQEKYYSDDEIMVEAVPMNFEYSELYSYFHDNKFLCIVFKEHPNENGDVELKNNTFEGFKVIDLSTDTLMSEAKRTWTRTRNLIKSGKLEDEVITDKIGNPIITPIGTIKSAPNFPKSSDYCVFIRGSGKNSLDKKAYLEQYGYSFTMLKQYYWIRGSYMVDLINHAPYLNQGYN